MGVLREFAAYYNLDRPHRSLDLAPPIRPNVTAPTLREASASRPVLGGPRLLDSRVKSVRLLPSHRWYRVDSGWSRFSPRARHVKSDRLLPSDSN
jgi:hypothetical protein